MNQLRTSDFKDQRKSEEITTISVILKKVTAQKLKVFRCNGCGAILFEYYDEIRTIFEGEIQDTEKVARILCKRDRIFYIIENARM